MKSEYCYKEKSDQFNINQRDIFFLNKNINEQKQFYNSEDLNLQNERDILLAITLDFQILFELNKNNDQIKNYLTQQFEIIKNNNISNLKSIINAEVLTIIVINKSQNFQLQEYFPINDFMKLQQIFYDIYKNIQSKQGDELFRIFLNFLIQNITEELCCFQLLKFNIEYKDIFKKYKVNSKIILFKPDEGQISIKDEIINNSMLGNVKKAKELFQELNSCWTQNELQKIFEEIIQQYLIYLIETFNNIKNDIKCNERKGRDLLIKEIKKSDEFDKIEINHKFKMQSLKEIIIEQSKNTLNEELSSLLQYNKQNFNKNLLEVLQSYFELNKDLLICNQQQQKQFQDYIQSKLQEGKNIQSKFIDYNQDNKIKLDQITQNLNSFFQTIDALQIFENIDAQLLKQLGIRELIQQSNELYFTSIQQKQIKNHIQGQQIKAEKIQNQLNHLSFDDFKDLDQKLTELQNIINSLQVFSQLERQMIFDQLKIEDEMFDQIKKLENWQETVKLVIVNKINSCQDITELIKIQNKSDIIQKIYFKFNFGQFDNQQITKKIKYQFQKQYDMIIEKIENKTLNKLHSDDNYDKQNFELDILKNVIDINEIKGRQDQIIRKMREKMKTFKDEDKKVYIPMIVNKKNTFPEFMYDEIEQLKLFCQDEQENKQTYHIKSKYN